MDQVFGVTVYNLINKTAYQLKSNLFNNNMNIDSTFDSAIEIIKRWLFGKLLHNKPLLERIQDIKQDLFEEYGGIVVEVTYSDNESWALRYKQPDTNIPARTWTTQVVIQIVEDEVIFETINMCSYPRNSEEPVPYSIPAFIRIINSQIGIQAPIKLDNRPYLIKDDADLNNLYILLVDKRRVLPVILLTQDNSFRKYSVDEIELAKKTFGLAYVILLPYEFTIKWVEKIGRLWAPYDGAIRTYLPNIDFENDELYWHPMAFKDKIYAWDKRAFGEKDYFFNFLTSYVEKYNSQDNKIFETTSIYSRVKHNKLVQTIEDAKRADSDDKEMTLLYQEENASLHEQIKELRQDLDSKESDFFISLCEISDLKEERSSLLNKLQVYEYALKNMTFTENIIPIYDSWSDMAEWCREYLPDKLVLSSKAKQAIKIARYEDIALVYKALLLYANEYRDMRMRDKDDEELVSKYNVKLSELGLNDLGPPVSESRIGERSNVYTTNYDGEQYTMEHHIGKGASFDPKYCLRIYATWDSLNNRVIIGSLPGHLDTRISN